MLFIICGLILLVLRLHDRITRKFCANNVTDDVEVGDNDDQEQSRRKLWRVLTSPINPADRRFQYYAFFRTYLLLLLFCYLPIVSSVLGYFDCYESAGLLRLTQDPSILYVIDLYMYLPDRCFEGDHMKLMPVAIVGFIIIVIGLPVSLLIAVIKNRKQRYHDSTFATVCIICT